jgi:PAS domain S-box-containing protein
MDPLGLVSPKPPEESAGDLDSNRSRVLIVDDSEDDAALLVDALRCGGYEPAFTVVDSPSSMRSALESQDWDVITSDHAMPHFSAPEALALAREASPYTPFIIVSGEIDLNLAVSLMKQGAHDYIQKWNLPHLVPAIRRTLLEGELRRQTREAKAALEASETRYRRLFETAPDGILILDADTGQIQDVNPFLMEMLGYSKDDFLGKRLWEIGAIRDKAASLTAFEALKTVGYVRYEDLPLQTLDGRQIEVEFVSNVYSMDHTRVAQCNIRNVTDRKRIEGESGSSTRRSRSAWWRARRASNP